MTIVFIILRAYRGGAIPWFGLYIGFPILIILGLGAIPSSLDHGIAPPQKAPSPKLRLIPRSKDANLLVSAILLLIKNADIGVFLDYLVLTLNKYYPEYSKTQIYYRLYRFFKRLEKYNIVSISKVDGLIKIQPKAVDLMFTLLANFKLHSRSLRVFKGKVTWGFLRDKIELSDRDYRFVFDMFVNYLEDVRSRVIVLRAVDTGEFLLLPYKTRFDRSRIKHLLKLYDRVWNYFTERYSDGVELDLTVDPRDYENVIQVRYGVSKAFNRLKAWIRKKLGFSPPHIVVYEFQDNGRLHLHVVFFGISRIADKKTELTPELTRIGFGKINWVRRIKNVNGHWVWFGSKPNNARCDPKEYLRKYLKKTLKAVELVNDVVGGVVSLSLDKQVMKPALYWALNCRFFSYSRVFKARRVVYRVVLYEFVMSFKWFEVPDVIVDRALNPDILDWFVSGGNDIPS